MKIFNLSIIAILSVMVFTGTTMGFAQVAPIAAFQIASFKGNHGTYPIPYNIVNGTVVGTPLDLPAKALLFEINTTSNGQLTVELPRAIIDSKNGSEDAPYFVSIYDIRSLGFPTKTSPEEITGSDMRILKINFTKNITEIQIVGTFFVEKYHYAAPNSIFSLSPLKQYEAGLAAKDVKCKDNFQLVIKSSDGSPACVKPESVGKLVHRGWVQSPMHIIQAAVSIPAPKISQEQAIVIVQNDLKNHLNKSAEITAIVVRIGDRDTYMPFSEFEAKNLKLPLVYAYPNGTLFTINDDASRKVSGFCGDGTSAYCGYLAPFNLNYQNRLVYGLDVRYGFENETGTPGFYAVDALNGQIVDSYFLRESASEK